MRTKKVKTCSCGPLWPPLLEASREVTYRMTNASVPREAQTESTPTSTWRPRERWRAWSRQRSPIRGRNSVGATGAPGTGWQLIGPPCRPESAPSSGGTPGGVRDKPVRHDDFWHQCLLNFWNNYVRSSPACALLIGKMYWGYLNNLRISKKS